MNRTTLLTTVLIALFGASSFAQNAACGFDLLKKQLNQKPGYLSLLKQTESQIKKGVNAIQTQRAMLSNMDMVTSSAPLSIIPIVVHIIYKGEDEAIGSPSNPSDAQIQRAIDGLNDRFSGTNSNAGASSPIRFVLAKRTPSGAPTNGINRVSGSHLTGYDDHGVQLPCSGALGAAEDDIVNLIKWPQNAYYNIWVVWQINATTYNRLAGYAYMPLAYNNSFSLSPSDRMLIATSQMNYNPTTLTHEMGHAFGLHHTFEGGGAADCAYNHNCSTDGDQVCDTDPVKDLFGVNPYPVDTDPNPCNNNAPYNGAQSNIMGYGRNLNRFTQGQADRMMAVLQSARAGLTSSSAALPAPTIPIKPIDPTQVPKNIVYPSNTDNMGPCNIKIGNMVYASAGYSAGNHYSDNTGIFGASISLDQTQVLTVTTESSAQVCKAWIDLNNNGLFEANEIVMNSSATSGSFTHVASISSALLNAPATVKNQLLRMRVMSDIASNPTFDAGTQLKYGQTEDFWVSLDVATALPVVFGAVDATQKADALSVRWRTNSEKGNDHFLIEGSMDGKTFVSLKKVGTLATNGISSTELVYNITVGRNAGASVLGAGILLVLVSLASVKQAKKQLFTMGVIAILLGFVSCNKHNDMYNKQDESGFRYIRIVQVDRDGTKRYSKIVNVIKD